MTEERTIKFIWDYYGEPALKTAKHHKIHLQEFAEQEHLKLQETGFEELSKTHGIAYILLNEDEALDLKNRLKPHKAYVVKN